MDKIKCDCGKDWKIQDNLSAYEGEIVLVCDCGKNTLMHKISLTAKDF
jgi:hypothetical protein